MIGIGNPLRRDDGAGPAVIRELRDGELPPGVKLIHYDGDSLSLISTWLPYEHVILVDATSTGEKSGTVYRLDASKVKLPRDILSCSSHSFSPAETIELARSLNRLPRKLVVYGIEGADFSYGQGVSYSVAQAVKLVAKRITSEFIEGL